MPAGIQTFSPGSRVLSEPRAAFQVPGQSFFLVRAEDMWHIEGLSETCKDKNAYTSPWGRQNMVSLEFWVSLGSPALALLGLENSLLWRAVLHVTGSRAEALVLTYEVPG